MTEFRAISTAPLPAARSPPRQRACADTPLNAPEGDDSMTIQREVQ